MDRLALTLLRLRHDLLRERDDRGDVPGWVLVVVMTAGLCAALYGVAKEQLNTMLTSALDQVK
ncbi:hypothetical protein P5P86_06630 [Nocardioides sp. BP30]|uniref:hypothetical protein n=1 Tax=Nocardioides sp. BP30 TaxID=3036374 RepID=UPI0024699F34|nr:hypothetical protein [Nocardioides sp. BP30]WGL53503.1 hypothetical protein P5P86_06630 [Nocardioides sp. BP30]